MTKKLDICLLLIMMYLCFSIYNNSYFKQFTSKRIEVISSIQHIEISDQKESDLALVNHIARDIIKQSDAIQETMKRVKNGFSLSSEQLHSIMKPEMLDYENKLIEKLKHNSDLNSNELNQYIEYLKRVGIEEFTRLKPSVEKNISNYSYKVHNPTQSNGVVVVRIDERLNGKLTKGGSNIHGDVTENDYRLLCRDVDHFNGSYTVVCPTWQWVTSGPAPTTSTNKQLSTSANCSTLFIRLDYVDFGAYKNSQNASTRTLYLNNDCIVESAFSDDLNDLVQGTVEELRLRNRYHWQSQSAIPDELKYSSRAFAFAYKISSKHKWAFSYQDDYNLYKGTPPSKFCDLIQSIPRIHILGSSHMRFKFDYILDICYEMPKDMIRKHFNQTVRNVSFQWLVVVNRRDISRCSVSVSDR